MSKNEENNNQIILQNNSTSNIRQYFHHKNKSTNILTDTPSTLISMQLHSIKSNNNSKNKEQKHISSNSNNNISSNTKKAKNNQSNTKNSINDMNNIRIKLNKISSQFSANTPKQLASIYNQLCGIKMDPSHIVVKKNLKLDINNSQKNKNNQGYKSERNNNNEFAKYVNNDKNNSNANILNMTQNYSKYLFSQSKSFNKIDNNDLITGVNTPNNRSHNNTNKKMIRNNKDILENIEKNKIELTLINKSTNNLYLEYKAKNIKDNNDISTSKSQNEFSIKNKKNKINSHSIGNKNISNDNNDLNIKDNKKIYFMKPIHKRKKSYKNKSNENSNNNTYQSSISSKNRNILDDNALNDFFNNNIENPEELHFFYVKILQKSKEISKKFEIN